MSGKSKAKVETPPAENWLKRTVEANKAAKAEKVAKANPPEPEPQPAAKRERSQPGGKSSDSRYTQAKVYIQVETRLAVGELLVRDPQGRDFSDLVDELLRGWVGSQRRA